MHSIINNETGELDIKMLFDLLQISHEQFINLSSNKIEKLLLYIQKFFTKSTNSIITDPLKTSDEQK